MGNMKNNNLLKSINEIITLIIIFSFFMASSVFFVFSKPISLDNNDF